MPFFLLSPATKTREGVRVAPAAWAGGPGGSAAAVGRGKERGGHGEPTPHLYLGRGAARRSAHGGGRRAAEATVAAALRAGNEGTRWRRWSWGVEGCEERLFIGGIRRWREGRGGGRDAVAAGRRASRGH